MLLLSHFKRVQFFDQLQFVTRVELHCLLKLATRLTVFSLCRPSLTLRPSHNNGRTNRTCQLLSGVGWRLVCLLSCNLFHSLELHLGGHDLDKQFTKLVTHTKQLQLLTHRFGSISHFRLTKTDYSLLCG